jgi:hypothetical protein
MRNENQKAFDEFWKAWPKRVAKKEALRAWERIAPEKYPLIMAALPRHKKQPVWLKEGGIYIPYPATWLNGERWEDEIILQEDVDAEFFIHALQNHPVMPEGLTINFKNRVIKMFTRMQTTWPRLHAIIQKDPAAIAGIRKEFLATPD